MGQFDRVAAVMRLWRRDVAAREARDRVAVANLFEVAPDDVLLFDDDVDVEPLDPGELAETLAWFEQECARRRQDPTN